MVFTNRQMPRQKSEVSDGMSDASLASSFPTRKSEGGVLHAAGWNSLAYPLSQFEHLQLRHVYCSREARERTRENALF